MHIEIRSRCAEAILVITGLIREPPRTHIDQYGDQATLQCASDVREFRTNVHLDHEMTVGRWQIPGP